MGIDKHYQEMIDEILNGASDREQLNIIQKIVICIVKNYIIKNFHK